MKYGSVGIAVAILLATQPTLARQIEGVELPEQIQRGAQTLVLNGAGVRKKAIFDVYVAALYVPTKTRDVKTVLLPQPKRLSMHFLRDVDAAKLRSAWSEGFAANVAASARAGLDARIAEFNALFPDVKKGDTVTLDYVPGQGVAVTVKGVAKSAIAGDDFAQALFNIWLGSQPVSAKLKQQLLGE